MKTHRKKKHRAFLASHLPPSLEETIAAPTEEESASAASSPCSSSSEEENCVNYISAHKGKHFHPIIEAIYAGDYPSEDSPIGQTIIMGSFPLFLDTRYYYGTKRQLFATLCSRLGRVPMSYNTFRNRTKNTLLHIQNRTDLCSTCYACERSCEDSSIQEQAYS